MSFLTRSTVVLATFICITGCNSSSRDDSRVLAKVNGVPLTENDVAFRLREAHGRTPQYGERSIEEIIDQELLYQQGLKLGLDDDPSYHAKLPKLNRQPPGARRLELARRVYNTQIAARINVTYKEGEACYTEKAGRIATELHLLMAKFATREEAEEAIRKVRGGADFAAVARAAMGETAVNGRPPWDLGFVKWEEIPVDFEDRVYALKPGEVSGVLGTKPTGFQVVKLLATRGCASSDYPRMSATVMNRLRDWRLLQAYQQYVAQLKKEAKIVRF